MSVAMLGLLSTVRRAQINKIKTMKFRSSNSLQEIKKRVITGRDSSNWLTENGVKPVQGMRAAMTGDSPYEQPGPMSQQINANAPAPNMDSINTALGPLASMYTNAVSEATQGVDWEGFDPNSESARQNIQNFAGNSFLLGRQLATDGDMRQDSGPGARALSFNEIQAMGASRDRNLALFGDGSPEQIQQLVNSTRPFRFDPAFVEATWNLINKAFKSSGALPGNYRDAEPDLHGGVVGSDVNTTSLKGKDEDGLPRYKDEDELTKTGRRSFTQYVQDLEDKTGLGPEELNQLGDVINAFSGGSPNRARLMWKLFLEQGGVEAYTGLPLEINNLQLEHVRGFQEDGDQADEEDWEDMYARAMERDSDQNFVLLNQRINNSKSDKTMEQFYKDSIDPLMKLSQEDFDFIDEKTGGVNTEADRLINTVLPLLIDSDTKQMRDGGDVEDFFSQVTGFEDLIAGLQKDIAERFGASVRRPAAGAFKELRGLADGAFDGLLDSKDPELLQILLDQIGEEGGAEELLGQVARKTPRGKPEADDKYNARVDKIRQALPRYLDQLQQYTNYMDPDNRVRKSWADDRAKSINSGPGKSRVMKALMSQLGLSHTWSRKGSEESTGNRGGISVFDSVGNYDVLEGVLKKMLQGGNEGMEGYRKLFAKAQEAAKEAEGAGKDEYINIIKQFADRLDELD